MFNAKKELIKIFRENVCGKIADVSGSNERHDGKGGHWLERQFLIKANANNKADIYGYELKNQTTSKTTFGDWSANRYIFKDGIHTNLFIGSSASEKQDSFCSIFGTPNPLKNNRCSWSGAVVPKIHDFNIYGQKLVIDGNLDILAIYSFSKDQRIEKYNIIPKEFQIDNLVLARWFGITSPTTKRKDKCLREKLEDKFNDQGWFTCKTDSSGRYNRICFGDPFNYHDWIELVRDGTVFFDSGMYQGNKRPYSQWRANNNYWNSLIKETYYCED